MSVWRPLRGRPLWEAWSEVTCPHVFGGAEQLLFKKLNNDFELKMQLFFCGPGSTPIISEIYKIKIYICKLQF